MILLYLTINKRLYQLKHRNIMLKKKRSITFIDDSERFFWKI